MINEKPTHFDICKNIDCEFYTDLSIYQDLGMRSWHTTANCTHCFFCKHRILYDLYKPVKNDREDGS